MKIISFAWTTPALVAGHKTVTRRNWNRRYARSFKVRDRVQAYDRSPRHAGKPVAILEIESVQYEHTAQMPIADYEGEGFAYLDEHPHLLPRSGSFANPMMVSRGRFDALRLAAQLRQDEGIQCRDDYAWVIRFRLLMLTEHGKQIASTLPEVRAALIG